MIPERRGLTRGSTELATSLLISDAFDEEALPPRGGAVSDTDAASRQAQCLGDQATNCVVCLPSLGRCADSNVECVILPADHGVLACARRDTNRDARQSQPPTTYSGCPVS